MKNTRISTPGPLDQRYLNVSAYRFVEIADPEGLRDELKARAEAIWGTILLSREGINLFLCGPIAAVRGFLEFLRTKPEFAGLEAKESLSTHVPFSRMLVKVKKEIITMGRPEISPARTTGKRVEARELKRWLDEKEAGKRDDLVLLDTRNDYEIAMGTFRGAADYGLKTFREFPEKLAEHRAELAGKTVVMFCTGGIRCEKATALAMEYGLKDVYQLEGGILKYFEEAGGAHYKGDCFVFDGRESVDPSLKGHVDREFRRKVGELKLYSYRRCPYAMRVRMALHAKRLPFEIVETDIHSPPAEFLALNSYGEVPVLVHDGHVLTESAVINEYLEELFPEIPLMPASAERRARVRFWTAWLSGRFKSDLDEWKYEYAKLAEERRAELAARFDRHFSRLHNSLRARPYLVSAELTLADIHVFPFVRQLMRTIAPPPGLFERWPLVRAWYERMEASECFQKAIRKPE